MLLLHSTKVPIVMKSKVSSDKSSTETNNLCGIPKLIYAFLCLATKYFIPTHVLETLLKFAPNYSPKMSIHIIYHCMLYLLFMYTLCTSGTLVMFMFWNKCKNYIFLYTVVLYMYVSNMLKIWCLLVRILQWQCLTIDLASFVSIDNIICK